MVTRSEAGRAAAGDGKIPVTLVIDALARAGTERQVLRLLAELPPGPEPRLVTFRPPPSPDLEPPCPSGVLPFRSFGSPRLPGLVRRFRRELADRGPGTVHAFFHDPPVLVALAARGLPLGRVASVRQVEYSQRPLKRFQLRLAYPSFDLVLVNSRVVADEFVRRYRVPRDRVRVVYNGVRVDEGATLDPEMAALARQGPVVGIVANANRPVKRLDVFLRAAAEIAGREPRARFVLVGGGGLLDGLRRMAADLGLADRVLFAGSRRRVEPWVRGFTVGTLASDLEGLPNAILEYMALGVPVVATRVGGVPELVEEGRTGLLVAPGAPGALAEAVLSLLGNPERARAMGEAGRRVARERFTVEAFVAGHVGAWRDALARRRAGRQGR